MNVPYLGFRVLWNITMSKEMNLEILTWSYILAAVHSEGCPVAMSNWDLGPQSDPCRSPNLALFGHEMVDLGLFLGIVAMSWIIGDITHVYHSVLDHPSSQSIMHRWYYRNCANSFRIVVLSCSLWNIPPFVTGPGCFRTDLHADGPSVSLVSLLVSWKSDPSKSKLFQPRIGQNLMIRPWLFTSGRCGTQPSQNKSSIAIGRSVQVEVCEW